MYDIHRIAKRVHELDGTTFQEVFTKQKHLASPINLSIGIPEGPTPDYIKAAGVRAIEEDRTVYTPANGIHELREALVEKLRTENSVSVSADEVTIVPGLTTGLLLVYQALLDPGDEIIVMDPHYPPYTRLAALVDARVIQIPTLPNFQLDLPAIEASITEKTKLILVNTPNNPTGAVYPKEDLLKLAELAKKHDIIIVSDEIYEHFVFESEHFSLASVYPHTITMSGFSKSYAMTGWRVGYIAGPADIIQAINHLLQYAVFSSSSIAQYAALEALTRTPHVAEQYRQKHYLVKKAFEQLSMPLEGAQGAYYAFFKVPERFTDLSFVEAVTEHGLILLPGRVFSQEKTFVRLSYGGTIEDVEKGLAIIKDTIQQA